MTGQRSLLLFDSFAPRRRAMLMQGAVLSAGAVALLGGRHALAAAAKASPAEIEADARILNTAATVEKLGGKPLSLKALPADPAQAVPGTTMGYAGVKDE